MKSSLSDFLKEPNDAQVHMYYKIHEDYRGSTVEMQEKKHSPCQKPI